MWSKEPTARYTKIDVLLLGLGYSGYSCIWFLTIRVADSALKTFWHRAKLEMYPSFGTAVTIEPSQSPITKWRDWSKNLYILLCEANSASIIALCATIWYEWTRQNLSLSPLPEVYASGCYTPSLTLHSSHLSLSFPPLCNYLFFLLLIPSD